jgi:HlyD family secretion protein
VTAKHIKGALKFIIGFSAIGLLIFAFLPEAIKVDLITVEKGDLLVTLEGEGKTRIHDIYVVSTPIDGRITRIESEAGDLVTAGKTIIANMYPANPQFLDKRSEIQAKADVSGAEAALALSNARVKQAQAQLDFELSEFKRIKELFDKHSVSQSGIERAELRIKTLRAELETAQSTYKVMLSRLTVAKARLLKPETNDNSKLVDQHCQICIHSPVDGMVLRILHKSESIVPVGTPLVEIGNPADLEVNIEMLSTNAVKVKVGDEALIKRWGGNVDIKAIVRVIEPSGFTKISALGVEEQRVNVILSFTDPIEKWQALGDAFRVEAAIITDRVDNTIKIPLSALFRQNEIWSVFKVIDSEVVLQEVEVGHRNDRFAEIKSGLTLNDQVITHPGNNIEEGISVIKR